MSKTKQPSRLTLIKANVRKDESGAWRSLYRCECGVEKEIIKYCVKNGQIKSCGCASFMSQEAIKRATDKAHLVLQQKGYERNKGLVGSRFGALTVIDILPLSDDLVLRCDCGNTVTQNASRIRSRSKRYDVAVLRCGWNCGNYTYRHDDREFVRWWKAARYRKNALPKGTAGMPFEEFAEKYYEEWRKLKDMGAKRFDLVEGKLVTKKWGRLITINGETRNLKGWAALIGLTRERARQLHEKGRLEGRVLEKFNA